jgi:chromate transporter
MLVAVAVIAQAVLGMTRSLCPDRIRASIAVAAASLVLLVAPAWSRIAAILAGAAVGWLLCREPAPSGAESAERSPVSRASAVLCLAAFAALLALAFLAPATFPLFAAFVRPGALAFGGGHVVLPLLRDTMVTPGLVSESRFLVGYGATQAVPGPLYTFAAYLGAVIAGTGGAIVALVGIFLPGILLVAGALPFWNALRRRPSALAGMRGANAAVVGLLAAALYDPVWTGTVHGPTDVALALIGFVLLTAWNAPPVLVVALGALAGSVA